MPVAWIKSERPRTPITRRRKDGTATRYRRPSGARLVYVMTLPDRSRVPVTLWFSDRGRRAGELQARALLDDAIQLEEWSRFGPLPPAAVQQFHERGLIPDRVYRQLAGGTVSLNLTWEDALLELYRRSVRDGKPKPHNRKMYMASRLLGLAVREGKIQHVGRLRIPWRTPAAVTPESVRTYLDHLRDTEYEVNKQRKRYTASTVNRVLFTIRQLLDAGGVEPNPARAVRMVKSNLHHRVPDCLDYREDVLLLRAARRRPQTSSTGVKRRPLARGYVYTIYLLTRFFGLRPDEAQYLTWEDVRVDRIIIQAKQIDPSETHERFPDGWWKPKDHELRAIDPPHCRLIIAELRRKTPREGRFVVGGTRVLHDVTRPVEKLLKGIGSKRAPYDLRHTFATWALTHYQGQPGDVLVRVQRWMGHSSLATTMRYLHAVPRPEHRSILRHFAGAMPMQHIGRDTQARAGGPEHRHASPDAWRASRSSRPSGSPADGRVR